MMKYAEYPLFAEGYINRFLTTGIFTKAQQFAKVTLNGRVNEWLKYGFSIHENPCRKEFIEKRKRELPEYLDLGKCLPGDGVTVFEQHRPLRCYFPFGNIGMEESGFYDTPTYLRSYSYAVIQADRAETVSFELTTCGGVTLWVNDALITDYVPFTRNMVKNTVVMIPLQQGENKFVICLDDLAERDTDYYFRIRRIGDLPLKVLIPVGPETDLEAIDQIERMLMEMSFDKEVYFSETVRLQLDNYLKKPVAVQVKIIPGEFIEKMERSWKLVEARNYQLKANDKFLELLHADEVRPGYYYFSVRIMMQGIAIKRKIGNQLVRKEFLTTWPETLQERKERALKVIIEYGVDNVYKAAAYLKQGQHQILAERMISEELAGVRARKDCSDFHFIIIIYIYKSFSHLLSGGLKREIEETMLGYRYWMDEPGDDVMWFFSENHALLFHICQYLAGTYLPEQQFSNSGLTGRQLHQKAIRLLDEWFDSFFKEFITEWNSNAYIPVDVLGLGTLYNLTEKDSEIHQKARQALDMIFYSLCINQHKGAVMTSFGRTYEKEMKGNYNAGTTALLYLAYQAGYLNRSVIGMISLVLGDYQAPEEYRRYLNLSGDQELVHQNTQGFEQHVNLYLYKNAEVLLSTAVGFRPFQNGYQEHIVQATIDESAQVFLNHPGESHPYGSGRPNFWAGNGVLPMAMQYRGISVIHYQIPDGHRIDYTHAYIPLSEFQQYMGESNTIVLEKDGGYIGVKALNGLEIQQQGPCRHREFISRGRQNVWILKVARKCDYQSLEIFFEAVNSICIKMSRDGDVKVTEPDGMIYRIDQQHQCYVNEQMVYHYPLNVKGMLEVKSRQGEQDDKLSGN